MNSFVFDEVSSEDLQMPHLPTKVEFPQHLSLKLLDQLHGPIGAELAQIRFRQPCEFRQDL